MSEKLLRFTSRNHITDRWLQDHPDARIECWGCGSSIPQLDPRQKYCNKKCAKKYYRRRDWIPIFRDCIMCDEEFEAKRRDTIYCGIKCQRAAYRRRKGIPELDTFNRECRQCSKSFIVTFPVQFYCTIDCAYKHRLKDKKDYNHFMRADTVDVWNQMREKFWFGETTSKPKGRPKKPAHT